MRGNTRRNPHLSREPRPPASTLFFALWPPPATRKSLMAIAQTLQAACGGRSPDRGNLHLTLAYLGRIADDRQQALCDLGSGIRVAPFVLSLEPIGWWRRQRLVWIGTTQVPSGLALLAAALGRQLRASGFRTESRAFVPHVTLLRDARREPPATNPWSLSWPVRRFVLARSNPGPLGVRYDILKTFQLAGGSEATQSGS